MLRPHSEARAIRRDCSAVLIGVAFSLAIASCSQASVPDSLPGTEPPTTTSALATDGAGTTSSPGADAKGSIAMTLDNGLDVIITSVPAASTVAIALVFEVGSHHDPPGQSGLGHFVEHVIVTAATSSEPRRTVDDFVAAYPAGWNAQTGSDFTVIATVFEPHLLEAELALTASRLSGVQLTQSDIDQERPRILEEVNNMFGGIASLAVSNTARERLDPTPLGGRRGGDPGVLAMLSLDQIAERLALYNPSTATLSIAGPVDPSETSSLVTQLFDSIPPGPEPPAPEHQVEDGTGSATMDLAQDPFPHLVTLAFSAPPATDADYPAFLVAVTRLFFQGADLGITTAHAPIDDPSIVTVTTNMNPEEDAAGASSRLRTTIEELLSSPLSADEPGRAIAAFGPIFGLEATGNSYGIAFSSARLPALGIDSKRLGDDLAAVDDGVYQQTVQRIFLQPPTVGASTRP